MSKDRGVHPGLLQRHFGEAGTGGELPPHLRRQLDLEARREAAADLAKMHRQLPKKPPVPPTKWVIEFRSGSYLQSLVAKSGGALETAMRFDSEAEADEFISKHEWVALNGGMAVRA